MFRCFEYSLSVTVSGQNCYLKRNVPWIKWRCFLHVTTQCEFFSMFRNPQASLKSEIEWLFCCIFLHFRPLWPRPRAIWTRNNYCELYYPVYHSAVMAIPRIQIYFVWKRLLFTTLWGESGAQTYVNAEKNTGKKKQNISFREQNVQWDLRNITFITVRQG